MYIDIASHAGQRLLCKTEYNAGAEGSATLLYAKYTTGSDEAKQNGILYGKFDYYCFFLKRIDSS